MTRELVVDVDHQQVVDAVIGHGDAVDGPLDEAELDALCLRELPRLRQHLRLQVGLRRLRDRSKCAQSDGSQTSQVLWNQS